MFQIWLHEKFQCQYPRCQGSHLQWSVLLDQIPLQFQRETIKEREDGERAIIREQGY